MRRFRLLRSSFFLYIACLYLFIGSIPSFAQVPTLDPNPPAPQLLIREGDTLVMIDGYTGERTVVREGVTNIQYFTWMPDGRSLRSISDENSGRCLSLVAIEPDGLTQSIACGVSGSLVSDDGSDIYYTTLSEDGNNETLWRYSLSGNGEMLYQTTEGTNITPETITNLSWSPTRAYLVFQHRIQIMGGTLNILVVLNLSTRHAVHISSWNPYYAYYSPVWSADDEWILIRLQDNYVLSGTYPFTNDVGDLYLFNADSGEHYRLTYTPTVTETDIHWTDTGAIAFTEIISHSMAYTLNQAMNITPVPSQDIVTPEPVDPFHENEEEGYAGPFASEGPNSYVSPDLDLVARVTHNETGSVNQITLHRFTYAPEEDIVIDFTESASGSVTLIGWQPSDYPYPVG